MCNLKAVYTTECFVRSYLGYINLKTYLLVSQSTWRYMNLSPVLLNDVSTVLECFIKPQNLIIYLITYTVFMHFAKTNLQSYTVICQHKETFNGTILIWLFIL